MELMSQEAEKVMLYPLEVVLAHLFVASITGHAFDARIREILTRIKEFRTAFSVKP